MTQRGTLRVAVIGTGRMGADHVPRIDEVISGARVSAVVDVDAERAKSVAAGVEGCTAYTEPAAAMAAADVDAVLIASPGPAHEAALLLDDDLFSIGRIVRVHLDVPLSNGRAARDAWLRRPPRGER